MKKFAAKTARAIPVILLADTSGSMSVDGKIDALNNALRDMVKTFANEGRLKAEIQLAVITFGGDRAEVHLPLTAAHKIENVSDLPATGRTPMGGAFDLVTTLVEDREQIPSRAYKPVLILVSDGHPTDRWEEAFNRLCSSERASKATRMAMAIGNDADTSLLQDFINDLETPVFQAHEARDIIRFFRAVSMSVTARSQSTTPNQPVLPVYDDVPDDDVLDLDF
ncbi:MAG: VWA domain-containing protein [Marinobacterium sp.]|nr:VWA domain-containing protein [Marinobacterium sp.]